MSTKAITLALCELELYRSNDLRLHPTKVRAADAWAEVEAIERAAAAWTKECRFAPMADLCESIAAQRTGGTTGGTDAGASGAQE